MHTLMIVPADTTRMQANVTRLLVPWHHRRIQLTISHFTGLSTKQVSQSTHTVPRCKCLFASVGASNPVTSRFPCLLFSQFHQSHNNNKMMYKLELLLFSLLLLAPRLLLGIATTGVQDITPVYSRMQIVVALAELEPGPDPSMIEDDIWNATWPIHQSTKNSTTLFDRQPPHYVKSPRIRRDCSSQTRVNLTSFSCKCIGKRELAGKLNGALANGVFDAKVRPVKKTTISFWKNVHLLLVNALFIKNTLVLVAAKSCHLPIKISVGHEHASMLINSALWKSCVCGSSRT